MQKLFYIFGITFIFIIFSISFLSANSIKDKVSFDFSMIEAGIKWLKIVKNGANNNQLKTQFMKLVAPTPGCQSIIEHWARFDKNWNNEAF